MSAYVEAEAKITNLKTLLAALAELGYDNVEIHDTPAKMYGYRGDLRDTTANVIVRRQFVGSVSNDLGFKRNSDGTYTTVISEYDEGHLLRKHKAELLAAKDFATGVAVRAAAIGIKQVAAAKGRKVTEKVEGRKLILTMKR